METFKDKDDLERDTDDQDQQKTFQQSIQQYFSSTVKKGLSGLFDKKPNENTVEDEERAMKTEAYEKENNTALANDLRNCLSDMGNGIGEAIPLKQARIGRLRAGSNEHFSVPLLDGKEEEDLQNYASNQLHEISGIASNDEEFNKVADGLMMLDQDDKVVVNPLAENEEPSDDLFGSTIARIDSATDDIKGFDLFMSEKGTDIAPLKAEQELERDEDEKEGLGDIFDSIDQFDELYGIKEEPGITKSQQIINPLLTIREDDLNDREDGLAGNSDE